MKSVGNIRTATQGDVARALNLSQSTVSRALRGLAVVPEKQRHAIQAAAARMGYRANASATALVHMRRTREPRPVQAGLAWINLWPEPQKLRQVADFDLYWQGASAQAASLGYHLEEFDACAIGSSRRLQDILVARGIDGVLLPPSANYTWDWRGFNWDGFCAVRMSRTVTEPHVHLVTTDQLNNTLMALREIRARGYRRIGFVLHEITAEPLTRLFPYGYLAYEWHTPANLRLEPYEIPDPAGPSDQRKFVHWLKRARPDAILADYPIAPWIRKAGYQIPADIGLAYTTAIGSKSDAGIFQNPEEIGRVSVRALASLIRDNERGIPPIFRQILVSGRWQDGDLLPGRVGKSSSAT